MATLNPSSAQSSSEPRADAASPVIFGLFVGVVALVASEFVPVSLLTVIAADSGVTPGVAGQSVTAVGLSAVAASLLAASFFPKTNRRRILLASMLMVTLSNAVLALTNDVALHFAARAVLGLAVGTFWSMSTSTVERLVMPSVVAAALAIVYAGRLRRDVGVASGRGLGRERLRVARGLRRPLRAEFGGVRLAVPHDSVDRAAAADGARRLPEAPRETRGSLGGGDVGGVYGG